MNKEVLLAAQISPEFENLLMNKGYALIAYDSKKIKDKKNFTGIITSTKLKLDSQELTSFPSLQWIARLGSGLEIIDLDYCHKHGIKFASSPVGIANAVGEHCLAMLVSLEKNIANSYKEIHQNKWNREPNRGHELEGSTIGFIGFGHTARAFAKKLMGFDCTLIAYDKYIHGFGSERLKEVSLEQLQEQADVISFHVPANDETTHYYDAAFIEACKQHIVINTSRGCIVNSLDLLHGLKTKKVGGAVLDVLENEEYLADPNSHHWVLVQELLRENTIITPHIAGYSHQAIIKMSTELMSKLKDVL